MVTLEEYIRVLILLPRSSQAPAKISWAEFSLNFEISSIRPGIVPEKLPRKLILGIQTFYLSFIKITIRKSLHNLT